VHESRRHEGGSVTAEFAIVVPAVIGVLALVLAGIALGRDALAYTTAAQQIARAVARGDDPARVRTVTIERLVGASVDIADDAEEVCVTVRANTTSGVRAWLASPTARACVTKDI
jgi:Flp pilus assembly protein TadG